MQLVFFETNFIAQNRVDQNSFLFHDVKQSAKIILAGFLFEFFADFFYNKLTGSK